MRMYNRKVKDSRMKHHDLISKMSLEEKCSLFSGDTQFTTKKIERLEIQQMYMSDGPGGIRRQAGEADHLGLNPSEPATCFPTSAAMANSWDVELEEELGKYIGREAKEKKVDVLLGPGLNIKRSPLCGRNFEYFSEDPYLSGKMAAAFIRGIQSQNVSACPKHFAVNNQETLRMHSDSVLDQRTLHEIYLTGFEIAVKEGRPQCIMSSYNKINGIYANENAYLLREILVKQWGFDGFVVTDWGGGSDRIAAVKAGNHLEMPTSNGNSDRELIHAVMCGDLEEAWVDELLDEYLDVLFSMTDKEDDGGECDLERHHKFARKCAEESIVLLKNSKGLLPLKVGKRVAVIGEFAKVPRYQGAGSSAVNAVRVDNILDFLKESKLDVIGYEPGFLRHGGEDEKKKQNAVRLSEKADIVLLFLGLDEMAESEGMDRTDMKLNQNQTDLFHAIHAVNPNIVVVLAGGAPFEIPWLELCPAVVHGYLGGQAGAGAMADVLTGTANPSGKLAETWPKKLEDTPCFSYFPGKQHTAEYREGIFVGYRYYQTAGVPICFPFGYGLSYTTFSYSNVCVSEGKITFELTNTGTMAGAEISQLYITKEKSDLFRPEKELKGFAKTYLAPGESRQVNIYLDDKSFRYYNIKTRRYEIEGGRYILSIGASAEDIRLSCKVDLPESGTASPYNKEELASYYSGKVLDIHDEEFAALLGHAIPPSAWDKNRLLGREDTIAQLFYAKSILARLIWKALSKRMHRIEKKGIPNLNIMFVYGLTFQGIAKLAGNAVDMHMVDDLLEIINGKFWSGLLHLIKDHRQMRRETKEMKKKLENMSDKVKADEDIR